MSEEYEPCKIWTRFESKGKDGNIIKLRIQDFPPRRKDDAIEFLVNYFMRDEAFQIAAGIYKNREAIQECRERYDSIFENAKSHTVICCKDDSDIVGEIIGLSYMQLTKNTEKIKDILQAMVIKTEEIKKIFHILKVLEDHSCDIPFETYYSGRGIAVHSDYRGLGMGNEFIKVRKLVCIDQKIPMTIAWMTAKATQKAAEKNNWKTFFEISLEKLEQLTGLTFEKKVPSFKLMYTTID